MDFRKERRGGGLVLLGVKEKEGNLELLSVDNDDDDDDDDGNEAAGIKPIIIMVFLEWLCTAAAAMY